MSRAFSSIVSGLLFVAALVAAPSQAYAQRAVLTVPRVAVVERGPRLSRLEHRDVWNDRGARIGTIADFVVDRDYAVFAILQVGAFLEVDAHLVAVPFKILVIDEGGRGIVLPGATREALRNYPEFKFRG
jgi:sporulation protein YlmC with PRC-barrel domain